MDKLQKQVIFNKSEIRQPPHRTAMDQNQMKLLDLRGPEKLKTSKKDIPKK